MPMFQQETVRNLKRPLGSVLGVALVSVSLSATAATVNFKYDGLNVQASGVITYDPTSGKPNQWPCITCNTGDGYTVTDITGEINGTNIDSLLPPEAYGGNTNQIYLTSPYLDFGDISFTAGGNYYDIYQIDFGDYEYRDNYPLGYSQIEGETVQEENFTHLDNFELGTASGVPEPGTWAMMLGGFGIVGGALRKRSRKMPARKMPVVLA